MIRRFYVTVNGRGYEVEIEEVAAFPRPVAAALELPAQPGPRLAAAPAALSAPPAQPVVPAPEPAQPTAPVSSGPAKVELPAGGVVITAPMPGKILSVKVTVGQSVKRGDVLMILEEMTTYPQQRKDKQTSLKKHLHCWQTGRKHQRSSIIVL